MKYLTHLENSLDSGIVSIIDVIKGLNGNDPIIKCTDSLTIGTAGFSIGGCKNPMIVL